MAKRYKKKAHKWNITEGYRASFLRMLPVLIMVGVVPLIVRQTAYETGLSEQPWFANVFSAYEFFLAPKALALTFLMLAMAVAVGMRIWKEKKRIAFAKILIPLVAYEILAFLSACFSVNRSFSFFGSYEQFESVWVLLSYGLVVYYIFLYAQTELELQVVTDAICFGATVVGLLGALQGLGFDYLATKLGQKLVTTEAFLKGIGGELTLKFEDNQAYATLYNPNYLGVFGAFILPFLVILILFEKNKWRRIWHCADFVLVAIAMLSSRSRAGLIAAGVAICVALLMNIRSVLKWWYLAIPAVNFMVALVLLVNAYNDNLLFKRLQGIFEKDNTTVTEYTAEDGTVVRETGLTEMFTTTEGVVFTYNEMRLQVSLYVDGDAYGIYATTEDGEQVPMLADDTGSLFWFEAPALSGVTVTPIYIGEELGICIDAIGKEWKFFYDDSKGSYQYVTSYDKASDMIVGDRFGFENYQEIFTGRGFVWSRTIPLLKKHIFLGSGPDTFLLEFPKTDYLSMYQYVKDERLIITRPHNMYLQIGVQTGVLSLICILVFYGWYAASSLRLYCFRNKGSILEGFGTAAFIGSIGYMVSGITNDSMVVTAPVFWGMIGLGITANAMVTKQRKENAAEAVKNAPAESAGK